MLSLALSSLSHTLGSSRKEKKGRILQFLTLWGEVRLEEAFYCRVYLAIKTEQAPEYTAFERSPTIGKGHGNVRRKVALQVEEGDSRHTYSQTSSNWTGVVNSIKKGTAAPSRMSVMSILHFRVQVGVTRCSPLLHVCVSCSEWFVCLIVGVINGPKPPQTYRRKAYPGLHISSWVPDLSEEINVAERKELDSASTTG